MGCRSLTRAMRSGAPYGMLASALRRDGGLHEGATAGERESRLRAWVARTAEGEPAARLTAFLGELVGVRLSIDDVELRAARADARLMSEARTNHLDRDGAAEQRVLSAIDDRHTTRT